MSTVVDTSPKCAEYLFEKDGCSSILIKCCLKISWGPATTKLMSPLTFGEMEGYTIYLCTKIMAFIYKAKPVIPPFRKISKYPFNIHTYPLSCKNWQLSYTHFKTVQTKLTYYPSSNRPRYILLNFLCK